MCVGVGGGGGGGGLHCFHVRVTVPGYIRGRYLVGRRNITLIKVTTGHRQHWKNFLQHTDSLQQKGGREGGREGASVQSSVI